MSLIIWSYCLNKKLTPDELHSFKIQRMPPDKAETNNKSVKKVQNKLLLNLRKQSKDKMIQ